MSRLLLRCLVNYAEEKNLRLTIIPRSHKQSDLHTAEESYFRALLGHELLFLEAEGGYPGYQAVDSVEVVVALDSTLGYESIARGNKTAIFSIRCSVMGIPGCEYGWPGDFPDEGLFWTNNPEPESFCRILDYLFAVDDVQWRKDLEASNFSSLMIYDPDNSMLKAILDKELGSPPASGKVLTSAQRVASEVDQ